MGHGKSICYGLYSVYILLLMGLLHYSYIVFWQFPYTLSGTYRKHRREGTVQAVGQPIGTFRSFNRCRECSVVRRSGLERQYLPEDINTPEKVLQRGPSFVCKCENIRRRENFTRINATHFVTITINNKGEVEGQHYRGMTEFKPLYGEQEELLENSETDEIS